MKRIRIILLSCAAVVFASAMIAGDAYGKACAKDLASCPMSGCEAVGSPHGLGNTVKRTVPAAGTPIKLTFDDFAELQTLADEEVDQNQDLTKEERRKLRELKLKSPSRTV
jgi:hypothetical protein